MVFVFPWFSNELSLLLCFVNPMHTALWKFVCSFISLANIYPLSSFSGQAPCWVSEHRGRHLILSAHKFIIWCSTHIREDCFKKTRMCALWKKPAQDFMGAKRQSPLWNLEDNYLNVLCPCDAKDISELKLGLFNFGMFQRRVWALWKNLKKFAEGGKESKQEL